VDFNGIGKIAEGFYFKSGLSGSVNFNVEVAYASEGAKTAFTKHCIYKLKRA
tara:strand:+ start:404 stop:559 length:156 start_codon:yes stop_codon:yes gene_type:complete